MDALTVAAIGIYMAGHGWRGLPVTNASLMGSIAMILGGILVVLGALI